MGIKWKASDNGKYRSRACNVRPIITSCHRCRIIAFNRFKEDYNNRRGEKAGNGWWEWDRQYLASGKEQGDGMKIVNEVIGVSSKRRCEMIDITGRVAGLISASGVSAGVAVVYCPHTTAAITINENADPSVVHDVLLTLEELIPQRRPGYRHGEGNSDAHTKSSLVGCSEQILIRDGQAVLGTWQAIYFCEFDGPRSRKVIVQVCGQ